MIIKTVLLVVVTLYTENINCILHMISMFSYAFHHLELKHQILLDYKVKLT